MVGVEVFNALNEGTILQRQHRLSVGNTDHILETLSPRVVRLGVSPRTAA